MQLVALDIELAAQLQLHRLQTAVYGIAGLAVLLVVIRLRDGVAPVDHQRRVTVVRNTRGADVDVARRAIGAHLQADLGEIGLAEKQQHLAQTVHAKVMVLVVGVDNRVQGLDGG